MGDQTHVSTRVMGTYGYAAPEYVMTGELLKAIDADFFPFIFLISQKYGFIINDKKSAILFFFYVIYTIVN